jgi:hypothetical protein
MIVIKSDNNQKLDAKVDIQQYLEETNQIKAQLGPLIDLSNAPILKHALQEDDPSNLISKKMLQGYTLIDSICGNPSCSGNIPLLRDKNGKLFCVLCDDNKSNSKQIEEKMNIDIGTYANAHLPRIGTHSIQLIHKGNTWNFVAFHLAINR